MKRIFLAVAALVIVAFVSGCAHPISLTGNFAELAGSGTSKLDKAVGLTISDANRTLEITGPGGGGDKVSYFPYRDLETGVYLALSESFSKVVRLNGVADPKVKEQALNYLITPVISTTSASPSLVTWPPTKFTVELICKVSDIDGKPVMEIRAYGEGRAEFDEFKKDFSLASKRAADAVLKNLVKVLNEEKIKLQ